MLKAAKDIAPIARSQTDAMATYGNEKAEVDIQYFPAARILNEREGYAASIGVLPPWVQLLLNTFHPWYRMGSVATMNLAGLAIAAVSKRLKTPTDRVDLLSKLQEGKDDDGKPMGRLELTAEALTELVAGSDTISKYDPHHLFPRITETIFQLVLHYHVLPRSESHCPIKVAERA